MIYEYWLHRKDWTVFKILVNIPQIPKTFTLSIKSSALKWYVLHSSTNTAGVTNSATLNYTVNSVSWEFTYKLLPHFIVKFN